MKPLLVDLETSWRGGQNQALLILRGLVVRGHHPELLTARGSALGERAMAHGIPVHCVSRGGFRLPAGWKIRELVRSRRFDLVHANEAHSVTGAWLASAIGSNSMTVPLVISRRVGYPIKKNALARSRYREAARIVANSRWVGEQVAASGTPWEKITIVYEGAEIPLRLTPEQRQTARGQWGMADDALLLGCVGALLPDKGQEWLIRAMAGLRKEFPAAKLLLAGEGPCRPRLEAMAGKLGIEGAVIFAGFVKDIATVYAALDVFLLPSFFEALNNSLLAAMAYGIPSIAFNRGALGEIIENEKSGLLVSGPDVQEICEAIKRFLGDRSFAENLGKEGRRRVEDRFSADRMVEGMIQVYEEVLRERPGAK